jgi:ABC-2 type transport system ATP-binding protein
LTEAPGFYDRMSAHDNLRFFGRLYGVPEQALTQRIEHYLKLMELWSRRDDPVGTYSKGMKQRLAIVRALFHEPYVVFLDEPTAGLDPEAALEVRELIAQLKSEGRTIVVCTHNLDEADRLADIVGILRCRLLVCETMKRLRAGSDDRGLLAVRIDLTGPAEPYAAALTTTPASGTVQVLRAEATILTVRCTSADVPVLVAWLVARGGGIREVRTQVETLEAVYLRTVRERP